MILDLICQIDDIREPYPPRLLIGCGTLLVLITAGLFYRSWAMKIGYESPITCVVLCIASVAWIPFDRNAVVFFCIATVGFMTFWAMINVIFRRKKDDRV